MNFIIIQELAADVKTGCVHKCPADRLDILINLIFRKFDIFPDLFFVAFSPAVIHDDHVAHQKRKGFFLSDDLCFRKTKGKGNMTIIHIVAAY